MEPSTETNITEEQEQALEKSPTPRGEHGRTSEEGAKSQQEVSERSVDEETNSAPPALNTPPDSSSEQSVSVRGEETNARKAQALQHRIRFEDCKISYAIDTSGSTLGQVLKCEQHAVVTTALLLSRGAKDAVRILPWSSHADPVTSLSGLSLLDSYGGTDPGVLLQNWPSLTALQNSSLWFLLTDGEIPEYSLQQFAQKFAYNQLHGTPCIVAVFGSKGGSPSQCNVSVGVSVFAMVRDCLFLFCDTNSEDVYILQCKGGFTEILERKREEQPVLDDDMSWEKLPRMAWSDLGCVSVSEAQRLNQDEVALENDLVINLQDLLSGNLTDPQIISAILDSAENIRTIALTARTRGLDDRLREWVIKQELDPVDFSLVERQDIGGQARGSMNAIVQTLKNQSLSSGEELHRIQEDLRAAHSRNIEALVQTSRRASSTVHVRQSSIASCVQSSNADPIKSRSMSLSSPLIPIEFEPEPANRQLFTRGFTRPSVDEAQFKGLCPVCATKNTILTLLLRKPPSSIITPGFPSPGSKSKLAFPLAMGNFPETDIISSSVCCDACSYIIVEGGTSPSGDQIRCASPLCTYSEDLNKTAYHAQLLEALDDRFDDKDVPLVFLAILHTAAQRQRVSGSPKDKLLLKAIDWACADLESSVECPSSLSSSFTEEEATVDWKPLREVLARTSDDALRSVSTHYLKYPMAGFAIMTMILDGRGNKSSPQLRITAKKTVFQRLLFHITEQFHEHLVEQGPILTHLLMSQLLVQDSARRERYLSPLDRAKSSFRGLGGLTRTVFGIKPLTEKLFIDLNLLAGTPLLKHSDLALFKKLGPLFTWVETNTGHALAVFLHYLYREAGDTKSALDHFARLAKTSNLARIFLDPSDISARTAEKLIESLPPLDKSDR